MSFEGWLNRKSFEAYGSVVARDSFSVLFNVGGGTYSYAFYLLALLLTYLGNPLD